MNDDLLDFGEEETKPSKPKKATNKKPATKKGKTMSKTTKKTTRVTAKSLIRDAILAGKTDDFIIKAVKKKLPESNVDEKHCTKYRRELFKEDAIGADMAACGSPEHREWAQENLAAAKKGPHKAYWVQWEKDQKAKEKAAAAAKKTAKKAA